MAREDGSQPAGASRSALAPRYRIDRSQPLCGPFSYAGMHWVRGVAWSILGGSGPLDSGSNPDGPTPVDHSIRLPGAPWVRGISGVTFKRKIAATASLGRAWVSRWFDFSWVPMPWGGLRVSSASSYSDSA